MGAVLNDYRWTCALTFAVVCAGMIQGEVNICAAADPQSEDRPLDPRARERKDTPVGNLLDQLARQNAIPQERYKDAWCQTLKEIVELGPSAVPELIEELDATEEDRMLRCLGFTLRAIGDPRAVPSLIRAIPRTLRPGGSDMGLRATDPVLAAFAQRHDLSETKEGNGDYSFGRPVREIFGALQKLTGQHFGEEELYHVFRSDYSSTQNRLRERLYHQMAEKWATHWEAEWSKYLSDREYAHVGLPKLEEVKAPEGLATHFKTSGPSSNWLLQSVFRSGSRRVFLDFDTGRTARLPDKWRSAEDISLHVDSILAWAGREGFDLMGTETVSPVDGQRVFVLRSIGMPAWELGKERWKMNANDVTLESLQAESFPADTLLVHYDAETQSIDPKATATFLYMTREGTVGLLFVGIEVQDDGLKPGGRFDGDDELRPDHFWKGRRFGFSELVPLAQ
jgi:hypothetical protein